MQVLLQIIFFACESDPIKSDINNGIEFEQHVFKIDDFLISYHNITSNRNSFSVPYPYSDMGTYFTLPEYSILGGSISVFHYLRVSWTFID